jgi:hypothetical protein
LVPACAIAAALTGCGSGDEGTIPQDSANDLLTTLDGIESSLGSGDCTLIPGLVNNFVEQVNALPSEVDDEVERGLTQAAANLVELSQDPGQCEPVTGQGGVEPEATSTEAETQTTTTDTETETDTTTDEQTDEEQPPPDQDEGGDEGTPPAELPGGGEGGGGDGGRGGSDSGGLTGEKERGP